MFTAIAENIKTIGACISGVTACGGAYIYLDAPLPASRQFVIAETQTLKTRLIDSQIQTNTLQRETLRKEKFDREIDLQKPLDPSVKIIIQQRLDTVKDSLEAVDSERDKLTKEKESAK